MSFLRRVSGLSLGERVRSSAIRRELGVSLSQLRWFGHLIRMPPGRLPLDVFLPRDPGEDPGHSLENEISQLAWELLGIPQNELENACWVGPLCRYRNPTPDKRQWMDGWTNCPNLDRN